MPLSWNEIRSRSLQFSKDWEGESSEHAEAKSFWDGFFNIFGVSRRRIASFEQHVKKIDGRDGFIDLLWKGVLLIEHKSRGKNLDSANKQALGYFQGLKERDLPRYIIVSDFARFRLYDLDESTEIEFSIEDLHKNINHFGFIAGYQTHKIKDQDPVNIKAAECMGKLHDQMKAVGYEGHPLELYLVRLLFCMFAEDTGIFERQQFQEYIEDRTNEDGSDLAHHLSTLFHVLNTSSEKRLKNRDEQIVAFPYVNGKLFEEMLPPAGFDSIMRQAILDACALDWSRISPAIFGSLFQSIMDKKARRNLGAHYTSEKNILKLINPLFMDDLRLEFIKVRGNKNKLLEFHNKLGSLTFFDPACGCGNFLVIAYRELRLLELEVLREANKGGQLAFDVNQMIKLDVDQFYGIEIEEFPAQIAQVALWLMDHQMNLIVSEEFGQYFARIPLSSSAQIVHGNALRIDWSLVVIASMRLKHVDLNIEQVFQDAREVKTKFSKTFTSDFFPVGEDIVAIVADWVNYLKNELRYGNDDPLFPKTAMVQNEKQEFEASGLLRECWSTASPIRNIFKQAFEAAELDYFHPHSFRKTLVGLGERLCQTPEEFKVWSQNLGHDQVLTTFTSYGEVQPQRQTDIFKSLRNPRSDKLGDVQKIAQAVAKALKDQS